MKVLALVSGGKDSCFSIMECQRQGHEVVALANLLPKQGGKDDLDSWMYQTVGHQVVGALSECTGLPLFRRRIQGGLVDSGLIYRGDGAGDGSGTDGESASSAATDEVEDLYALVAFAKQALPGLQAVCSGAIASDYQRTRVESVCARLGLVSLAPLWHRPQAALVRAMVDGGVHAILVKVAAIGLDPARHLGRDLGTLLPHLHALRERYGSNVCGEGGEYETLTLDCPAFSFGRVALDRWEAARAEEAGDVAVLRPLAFHVERKEVDERLAVSNRAELIEVPDDWRPGQASIDDPVAAEAALTASVLNFDARTAVRCADGYVHVAAEQEIPSNAEPGAAAEAAALFACLDAAGRALAEHRCNWEAALYVHLFVPAMSAFAAANAVRSLGPVRAVRADVLAAASPATRRVLHVQSISGWAPSCIGPYAQVVSHRGLVRFAGQIGLVPSSMAVIEGGLLAQTRRCLQSCQAVAVAVDVDLPRAMLFAAVFLAEGAGDAAGDAARAVHAEIDAFLSGKAAEGTGSTQSDDEEDDNDDPEAFVDSYLCPPTMPPRTDWQPLLSYLTMRNLPRGVLVELQPTACNASLLRQPDEVSTSSDEEDDTSADKQRPRHRPAVDGPVWKGWMADLSAWRGSSAAGVAHAQALLAPGRFLQAQVWLRGDAPAGVLEGQARAALEAAGLAEDAIVWARLYCTDSGESALLGQGSPALAGVPIHTIHVRDAAVAVDGALQPAYALLELYAATGVGQ
ncbi:hypothetical protein QBZ16_002257 [Prototheca wickerhamii]|uniref:Diphthine--ammonia ligase n=1 Tax=Prototheca wickerhamii TaxID=3111 RepID=A0AAD9MJG9_PROWI|nr:hypothetical protein QBZ16_002257 [Prototheca wickerhamii]